MESFKNKEANVSTRIEFGKSVAINELVETTKILLKQHNVHIPYILNGELYEIQTQNGEYVTVKCCNCPPDRVYRGSVRSTGNFHMHIKRRHPDLLGKLHDMKVNALLERRDRFIKNRKVKNLMNINTNKNNSSNNNNNDSVQNTSHNNGTSNIKTDCLISNNQDMNQTPMHKLKIKTAFVRHQQQEAMRKQLNSQHFLIFPSRNEYDFAEPINFSLKRTNECQIEEQNINQSFSNEDDDSRNHYQLCSYNSDVYSDGSKNELLSISSISCSPSSVNIFGNTLHEDQNYRSPVFIIKNENMSKTDEESAIDLTTKNSNNILFSTMNTNLEENVIGSNPSSITIDDIKLDQLFSIVKQTLRDIHREMCTRNEIETNRMYLDIAKFKYLNPGFNFNC